MRHSKVGRAVALAILLANAAVPAAADPLATILEHRAATAAPGGSQGCGAAPALPPATIEVDGRPRQLIVVPPEDYRPDVRHALVIAFHGRTSTAEKVRRYYGLERHAERPTLFVYPSGLPAAGGRMSWSDDGDLPDELRDYRLFDKLVRRIDQLYCIDRARIFAVGHSLGAWFVNSLACARGDVLRAIGTVAGGISAGTCRGRPSALLVHHPLDRLVPYDQGRAVLDVLADQAGTIERATVVRHAGFDCLRVEPEARLILFCPHLETRTSSGRVYPHQWPDGAGRAIMRFFEGLP